MKRSPRGFYLMELATALAVLGGLAVVATQLFRSSLRLTHESVATQEATIRMRSAIEAVRADIWNASEFTSSAPGSLRLASSAGNSVDWSIDGNDLSRMENGQERRWIGVGEGCRFEVDGPNVVLHSIVGGQCAELRLVSQLQLANREAR